MKFRPSINNRNKESAATSKLSFSQCGEDLILDFLICNILKIEQPFYIDIGANDPTHINNTYLFYTKGSTGVCVEPNMIFADMYKSVRPRDELLLAGIGVKDESKYFYSIDPHTLSTFSKKEAESYTKSGRHKLIETVSIPIIGINSLLNKVRKPVHLLNLDIEGYDFDVLKALDYKKNKPWVICVETLTYTEDASETKITKIPKLLESEGYFKFADTYINSIFVDIEKWKKIRGIK